MATGFVPGREYSTEEQAEWSAVVPAAGSVLEINLLRTTRAVLEETWAAFFIKEVRNEADGSYVLLCHFIGCEDELEAASFEVAHREGPQLIHLCLSTPCLVVGDLEGLHTTTARFWEAGTFSASYVPKDFQKKLARWQKELSGSDALPKRRARGPAKPKGDGGVAGRKKTGEEAPKKASRKRPATALPDGAKEKLEKKLKALRDLRDKGAGQEKSPNVESVSDESGASGSEEDSSGYAPTEPLATGSLLEGVPTQRRRGKDRSRNPRELVPYAGTREPTMKGLSGQLAQKALAVEDVRAQAKRKKKKKKTAGAKALSLLRELILDKASGEKKDKKAKDRKEKRKKKRRLENGVIVSSSSSSGGDSDSKEKEEKPNSSEDDMEAPMRRKSRDSPGSVLSMLTEHVRSQMEQDSVTEVDKRNKVTGGVKVTSFFNLHIRPSYGQHLKELREMYTLSMTIDLLRKGDLARVGDSLSARFMALHQSLIDQSWSTARHMELFPLEESTAASSALVLASRKHQRLVDKVQGKPSWTPWQAKGKGYPKGDWGQWGDGNAKGKKGKGNSNKGKGKGKGNWNQAQDKGANEWEKNKEKAEGTK